MSLDYYSLLDISAECEERPPDIMTDILGSHFIFKKEDTVEYVKSYTSLITDLFPMFDVNSRVSSSRFSFSQFDYYCDVVLKKNETCKVRWVDFVRFGDIEYDRIRVTIECATIKNSNIHCFRISLLKFQESTLYNIILFESYSNKVRKFCNIDKYVFLNREFKETMEQLYSYFKFNRR